MLSLRSIISPLAVAILFLVAIASFAPTSNAQASADAKHWALLVAGSKGYSDYRHQADICHAYHVLHNHGISDEHIVVMMYDDIAQDPSNPTPGIILNHPNGSNVYEGVPKDYAGDLVTPENFLSILQGKKIEGGSGKVIASGPNDHVFVYFSDHGSPGLIVFPNDYLQATNLIRVIKLMHEQKAFGKLVFYPEACYSGSMFENLLPDDINVYATTAANSDEKSYACYWDDSRKTFLGNLYSVNWMKHSDREGLDMVTLQEQFKFVRSQTNTSHVIEFGDLKIANLKVSDFQGAKSALSINLPFAPLDAVDSRDVPIAIVRKKLQKATDPQIKLSLKHELEEILRSRAFLKEKMVELVSFVTLGDAEKTEQLLEAKIPLRDHICYEQAVRYFDATCFELSTNPHAVTHLHLLVHMCEQKISVSQICEAMDNVCTHPTVVGIV
ncbi:legumain-like [Ixodes scapularis]|uniref:legumain-like n=1 Tax=Ixodes scapularis TaxID=6945 RepID=UPI001C38E753|nr:legumain-like [Ixodes scapularis]